MDTQRFRDRTEAGQLLACSLDAYAGRPDAVVLALPRGGVPVGFAVAEALHLALDIILVRKLGAPGHEELAMGAIASGGQRVVRPDVMQMLGVDDRALEDVARREMTEMQRRETLYRAGRPARPLDGAVAILIDDGLATGATMMAAVRAVRTQHPARVVVAVPVGASETCRLLEEEADQVVCLRTPASFRAVSLWYQAFPQTSDDEVIDLLERARGFGPPAGSAPARPHGQPGASGA
jgi:putative phosphoribosyl transferase